MIPKRLVQTWKTSDVPDTWKPYQKKWKELHPNWKYCFYTDEDNDKFVKENFPWVYPLYQTLPYPINRVDLFRILYLYEYGGVYADLDMEPLKCIDCFCEQKEYDIVMCRPDKGNDVEIAIIFSVPKHPIWLGVVEEIQNRMNYSNFKTNLYQLLNRSLYILSLTGPKMMGSIVRKTKDAKVKVYPHEVFFPKQWHEKAAKNYPNSYTVHHTAGTWISAHDKFWKDMLADRPWLFFIILILIVCLLFVITRYTLRCFY